MVNTAVLAIIKKDKKYLLGVESKDSPIKGQWRFLGGHLKPNENSIEGIIREIQEDQEEANTSVMVIDKLYEVQGDYVDVNIPIQVLYYRMGKWEADTETQRN
jgi:ADP-ribose pyrophosphatase YjhB (NUDIX family)